MLNFCNHKARFISTLAVLTLLISVLGFLLFNYSIKMGIYDLKTHIEMSKYYSGNNILAPNFIYYSLIATLSVPLKSYIFSAATVLGLSVGMKYLTSAILLKSLITSSSKFSKITVIVAPLFLLFTNHILTVFDHTKSLYIGKIPLYVWHNSTSILLAPFAILLFYYTVEFLKHNTIKLLFPILLLSVINIYIKPSFIYVYLFALPVSYVFVHGVKTDNFSYLVIISVVIGLLIVKQFFEISNDKVLEVFYRQEKTTIELKPFYIWNYYSNVLAKSNIFIDFVASFAFPLVFIIFYFKESYKDIEIQFPFLLLFGAMLILILFAETGNRTSHGNFFWQAYICNYLFFISCFKKWITIALLRKKYKNYDYLISLVFILHFLSGGYYLFRFIKYSIFM